MNLIEILSSTLQNLSCNLAEPIVVFMDVLLLLTDLKVDLLCSYQSSNVFLLKCVAHERTRTVKIRRSCM